jgi:hypothetical protein
MSRILPIIKAVAAVAVGLWILNGFVEDVREGDPIHYFVQQPGQMLWVAVISIGGGLIALLFSRSSRRWQRHMKLFALAAAATALTVCAGDFLVLLLRISRLARINDLSNVSIIEYTIPFGVAVGAAMLWFLFYRVAKKPVP